MERINFLLSRYLDNQASDEEIHEMLDWLRKNGHNEDLLQQVWEQESRETPVADLQRMWMNIETTTTPVRRVYFRSWWAAAAVILAVLATGAYFWTQRTPKTQVAAMPAGDVLPGGNRAVLTLADGSTVALDSTGSQVILQGAAAVYQQGGQLKYDVQDKTSPIAYNILTTPRGGQFRITLPDGTQVWLNAASSIRYPVAFSGTERSVEITGEAYFEVKKNALQPFKVKLQEHIEIEVLGTHFNVHAYQDESSSKTSLLEGSVRVHDVTAPGRSVILKPGQQARISTGQVNPRIIVNDADVTRSVAWKNGLFNFEDQNLEEVMRQLSRWYDIDVIYEKKAPGIIFGGEMGRNLKLSDVLMILERFKVRFRIENGKRLIVMP